MGGGGGVISGVVADSSSGFLFWKQACHMWALLNRISGREWE